MVGARVSTLFSILVSTLFPPLGSDFGRATPLTTEDGVRVFDPESVVFSVPLLGTFGLDTSSAPSWKFGRLFGTRNPEPVLGLSRLPELESLLLQVPDDSLERANSVFSFSLRNRSFFDQFSSKSRIMVSSSFTCF